MAACWMPPLANGATLRVDDSLDAPVCEHGTISLNHTPSTDHDPPPTPGGYVVSGLKERLLGGPSWEESIWAYRLQTWRCVLFGHRWGEPEEEYEDIYHVATRRYCQNPNCGWSEETWNVYR